MVTEWTNVAGFVLTIAVTIAGVAWLIADNFRKVEKSISGALEINKKEFNALIDLKIAEQESKIGKVWERFDTYKNTCDNTFVRQQTCSLIHGGTEKTLAEINRRQESMEKKLDALIVALVEKK